MKEQTIVREGGGDMWKSDPQYKKLYLAGYESEVRYYNQMLCRVLHIQGITFE